MECRGKSAVGLLSVHSNHGKRTNQPNSPGQESVRSSGCHVRGTCSFNPSTPPRVNGSIQPAPDGFTLRGKPRILLAEDEPTLRQLLIELLREDYELLVAPDGERAWEMAVQDIPPDIVLSDVEMPGLSGIELTRRLRAQDRTASVPIVLFSANNRLPTLLEGLAVGADDYLLKPFRPAELLARLRSRYQLCAMRRELFARQHGSIA